MKVTTNNVDDIKFIYDFKNRSLQESKKLLISLLIDIADINALLIIDNKSNKQIFIDYENEHTEYSPERTDPCPDYYGTFTLRFENDSSEKIGPNMDINDLDTMICGLYNFVEFKPK
jgi:hypothetical protein